jgi:hypothetical protein
VLSETTKNHQPHLRVVACVLLNSRSIRQASNPARALWPLIRIAGAMAAQWKGIRMALMAVDQK